MVTRALADYKRPPAAVPLMGLDFAAISELETIDYVLDRLADGRGGWIATVNLDILRQLNASAELRELVSEADLIVADGMPLLWAGELQGSPLPERVAGSTLVTSLTAAAADAGASIFLIGGNPGSAEGAERRLTTLCPHLRLAGTFCPPIGFERDPEWLERIEREVSSASPDIVYVALGFPKQERLIARLRDRVPTAWFVPCGIAFSYLAGEIHRAPPIVQRLGLEWLHRMVQEPKRLCGRYLFRGIPFLVSLLWSSLVVRLDRGRPRARRSGIARFPRPRCRPRC